MRLHGHSNDNLLNWYNQKSEGIINELQHLVALGKLTHNLVRITGQSPILIPAGYTYFGQFIDHDIIFSSNSCPVSGADCDYPLGFKNQLDLSSIYGERSNLNSEKLDVRKNGVGKSVDVPRHANGIAKILDSRNDENLLISQFQLLIMRTHNRIVDIGKSYEQAKQQNILIYKNLVKHDYLKQIILPPVWELYFGVNRIFQTTTIFDNYDSNDGIPIEFSKAAFRFGHSMVLDEYVVNTEGHPSLSIEKILLQSGNEVPPERVVDWHMFFGGDAAINANVIAPRISFEVEELISDGLRAEPGDLDFLAVRNLLRGKQMSLPSFQEVSLKIINLLNTIETNNLNLDEIKVLAEKLSSNRRWLIPSIRSQTINPAFYQLNRSDRDKILDTTPLWYAILCEAYAFKNMQETGYEWRGLGVFGSIILADTFSKLLDSFDENQLEYRINNMTELLKFIEEQ